MKIAIDIDGVIADSCSVFSRLALFEKIPTSDKQYDLVQGVSDNQRLRFRKIVYFTIENQLTLVKPYTGARKAIAALSKMFDQILLVTARDPRFNFQTNEWLLKYIGNIDDIGTLVNLGSSKKTDYLLENNFDTFIEDRLKTANTAAEAGIRTFLVKHSWNTGRKIYKTVEVIPSLSFLPKLLRSENFVEDCHKIIPV